MSKPTLLAHQALQEVAKLRIEVADLRTQIATALGILMVQSTSTITNNSDPVYVGVPQDILTSDQEFPPE